jgi:hypothetical protein
LDGQILVKVFSVYWMRIVGPTWCGCHTNISWIHVSPAHGSHLNILWVPHEQYLWPVDDLSHQCAIQRLTFIDFPEITRPLSVWLFLIVAERRSRCTFSLCRPLKIARKQICRT